MLENLSIEEFNEFSKNHEQGTFFQSSYWGELKKTTGWIPHIVGIKEGYEIKGASLILAKKIPLFNKYIFYAPRGFLLNYKSDSFLSQFTKEIVKYVKLNKGIFLKINPYIEYQKRDIDGNIIDKKYNSDNIIEKLKSLGFKHNGLLNNYGKDLEPRWLSVLDIKDKTEEEILKNMRSTTRWSINNSYKHGLKLVEINENEIEEYKKLMEHTGERRGFIDRSLEYYKNMYKVFSKNNNIKIVLVKINIDENLKSLNEQLSVTTSKLNKEKNKTTIKENIINEYQSQIEAINKKIIEDIEIRKTNGNEIVVAGGLFMDFGKQVISLFGASYKEFMKFNGQYFLNYEMIKYAIRNKKEKFNFFGITGEFNEDSKMYGLFNFKRGFGANVVELIGEFNIVTNKLFNVIYKVMYYIYRKTKR